MSTSNIKAPVVLRGGFLDEWDSSSKTNLSQNTFLKREFERLDLLLVDNYFSDSDQIIYYKWLQTPFISYKQRKLKGKHVYNVSLKFKKDKTQVSKSNLINYGSRLLLKRQRNYFERIKRIYEVSKSYVIPLSVQTLIWKNLKNGQQLNYSSSFTNIYTLVFNYRFQPIDCLNFSFFAVQLSMWRNFKYFLDTVVVCDFLRLNLMNTDSLFRVIQLAFMRNSKKGQQRFFLVFVQKLLSLLPSYIKRADPSFKKEQLKTNLQCVIVISGKFAVTGRTQKFTIQPTKLPLHTLSNVYDYTNGLVNTKAGTFSIRLWRVRL